MLWRRSPTDRSSSGLVSRDYQPIVGGPKLVTSWPLGPAPGQERPTDEWEITATDWTGIQTNILSAPHLAPVDHSPTYLVVCGRGHVQEGETMTLRLSNPHLSGKPYETTVEMRDATSTPFLSSTVEFAPDRPDQEDRDARQFPEYVLEAKVTGGTGYLHPGTGVQLWSE